jgi:putative hydrolase of the HAD superfamily
LKKYQALLFDLCDTVMPFRNDRMPLARIQDREVRTTSPLLYECFTQYAPPIPYEEFHNHFVETTESIWIIRDQSGEEISSAVRFERFLERLGIGRGDHWEILHRRFLRTHLDRISLCLECAPPVRDLLLRLREEYRIGLVSNFDDTDTVHQVLTREGIHHCFEAVIISSEIGLRKPRPEIFLAACEKIGVAPAEALFIGDSFENDIVGAKRLGMDAAWINPIGLPPPIDGPRPDYILSELTDLTKFVSP